MVLKQSILYLLLSIIIVVFAKYAQLLVVYIDVIYTYFNLKLNQLTGYGFLNNTIREVISLALLPIFIAAIPALGYRLVKKQNMPYFLEITWFLWLVIVLSKILIR